MHTTRITNSLLANAAEINRLKACIDDTVQRRDSSKRDHAAWEAACRNFHSRYGALAFPGGCEGMYERITGGDERTMEAALCFLECRPYFFRSGYLRTAILRRIKRAPLSTGQQARLTQVLAGVAARKAARRQP